jgi:tetratricopeptide (TPR) repeat protein
MINKDAGVRLKSNIYSEFNVNLTLGKDTYHVQTEFTGIKNPLIITRIYYDGQIVYSKKTDCSDILNIEDFDDKFRDIMGEKHRDAIEDFTIRHKENRKKIEYFDTVKKLLIRKNNKQALKVLEDGLEEFPSDPFIMSYFGYLSAIVEKKYKEGIAICKKVLKGFDPDISPDERSLYAEFYLNLGKAYLAAEDKKSAIDAFNDGLRLDKDNRDIRWELQKLGIRSKPLIPFFKRGNPVNKYIGLLISRLKGK